MEKENLKILKGKVKKICSDFIAVSKDNVRLARLLLAAEAKVKKLTGTNGSGKNNLLGLSKQIEKFKSERKMIKLKVEKMVNKLDKFYEE